MFSPKARNNFKFQALFSFQKPKSTEPDEKPPIRVIPS